MRLLNWPKLTNADTVPKRTTAKYMSGSRPYKETTYRGIAFKSKTEANVAKALDTLGIPWEYETKCGITMPYTHTGKNGAQYTPDFWLPEDHVHLEVVGKIDDDHLENARLACAEFDVINPSADDWHDKQPPTDEHPMFFIIDGDGDLHVPNDYDEELFFCDCDCHMPVVHSCGWYACPYCGRYDGDHHIDGRANIFDRARRRGERIAMEFDTWVDDAERESAPLPDGNYNFTVVDFEKSKVKEGKKNAGANMAVYDLSVSSGGETTRLKYFIPLVTSMRWKAVQFFKGIGMIPANTPDDANVQFPWNSAVGRTGVCHVVPSRWIGRYGNECVGNSVESIVIDPSTPPSYLRQYQPKPRYQMPWDVDGDIPF